MLAYFVYIVWVDLPRARAVHVRRACSLVLVGRPTLPTI